MKISLIPIEEIKPHEEYDSILLSKIIDSIKKEGIIKDPIAIADKSFVILDGTHRYFALKELGCKYMPSVLYNYKSQKLKIACWYRCLTKIPSMDIISNAKSTDRETALNMLKLREASLAIIFNESSYVFDWNGIYNAYRLLDSLTEKYKDYGIYYAKDNEAFQLLESGMVKVILAVPSITKDEVINAAKQNNPFPKKSTRHILPYRVLGLNIPINWLMEELEIASKKLEILLKNGRFNISKNEEELYIFESKTSFR
ncbi:MAG: ParB N-terminal domain-containing protein [Candidatus Methanomethylicaceae archaeon]|nr:ParB N-terminal domain-containing protein [Candidatus Verstraetearchaeota archaeon]